MPNICVDPDDFDTDETGRLVLKTGCGLKHSVDGVTVDVEAWPYACDQGDNAQKVYCDPATGLITGPPVDKMFFVGDQDGTVRGDVPHDLAAAGVFTATFDLTIDNTDGCGTLIAQVDVQTLWQVTNDNDSDAWTVRVNREIDGGGFSTFAIAERWVPSSPAFQGQHGSEFVARVDRITVAAGTSTTHRYQTEITNDGASTITVDRLGVRASGIAMTQHV